MIGIKIIGRGFNWRRNCYSTILVVLKVTQIDYVGSINAIYDDLESNTDSTSIIKNMVLKIKIIWK